MVLREQPMTTRDCVPDCPAVLSLENSVSAEFTVILDGLMVAALTTLAWVGTWKLGP